MMNDEKKEYFREILNSQLKELVSDAEKNISTMTQKDEEHFPDPADRASMETDRSFSLRVKDRERKLVGKVEEALKRLEENEYGLCEICDGQISDKRLEARPVTTYCIECKEEAEETEKQNKLRGPKKRLT